MSTLQRAIEIATEAHKGQYDKSGKDYIGHPLRVMEMGKTDEEKIVGVLHDVIEDTDWTFEALAEEGFSKEIINALRCVTKISENENYDDFIERVKKNPLAVAVKINDLSDNMDIRRLPYMSDKDVKRAIDALLRRGHSYGTVRKALSQMSLDSDEFQED